MSSIEGLSLGQIAGPLPVRHVLPNGLEVVVAERPGCGLMSAQVWVRTGSLHEGLDEGAGLSHYLEHLVFKGTERLTARQLTDRTAALGCTSNAYTTFDRTVYHLDGPEESLDGALEILSEMTLAPTLADADAALEKSVILREIDMYEDEHDSVLAEAALAEAYRAHPLRHPVIGHKARFAAVGPERPRAYHAARYTTENLVLAVAGSVPAEEVLRLASRWFGRFPRRSPEARPVAAEPVPAAAREVRLIRDVSTSRGVLAWRAPGILSPDSLPIDLVAGLLGSGRSSLLWRELRERLGLVHAISCSAWGVEDTGLLWVGWSGEAGVDPREVEAAAEAVVQRFLQGPISAEDFAKVRRQAAVGMVNAQKTVHGLASRAGYAVALARDERQAESNARQLAEVTPEQLLEVARRWLVPANRTVASMRREPLPAARAVGAVAEAPGPFTVRTLPNGVRVILQPDRSLPKVAVGLVFAAGVAEEPAGKGGLNALMSTLLARDTARRSSDEVAAIVGRLGLSFRPHGSQFSSGLLAEGLSADFDAMAELVADGVLTPAFAEATVARERAAQADACREELDDVVELARQRLLAAFYGEHPLSKPLGGTPESTESLTLADLRDAHARLVRPGNLIVGVAGDLDPAKVEAWIASRLAPLAGAAEPSRRLPLHKPLPAAARSETVEREQAVVMLGFPHCGLADPRVTAANLTEELLSGMSSGLFRRVREEKGLAYFVGASRLELADQGMFYLYSGTHAEAVATVEAEMRAELVRLEAPLGEPDELESAKRRMRVGRREARQTPMGRLPGAMLREMLGLGANFEATWESRLAAATAADVAAYVREHLRAEVAQSVVLLPKG